MLQSFAFYRDMVSAGGGCLAKTGLNVEGTCDVDL